MARHPRDERADEFAGLAELAEAFTALVTAVRRAEPRGLTAPRVLDLAGRCLPSSQGTDLIVLEKGRLRSVAASTPRAAAIHQIRCATGQGPVLDVLDSNDLVLTGDLADDSRWPDFSARVIGQTGVRSILTYRLYLGPDHKAALSYYSDWPHAFDELAIATGAIFASYCSLTLLTELLLADTVSTRRSYDVHREMGVALGMLMSSEETRGARVYRSLHQAGRDLAQRLSDTDADSDADSGAYWRLRSRSAPSRPGHPRPLPRAHTRSSPCASRRRRFRIRS